MPNRFPNLARAALLAGIIAPTAVLPLHPQGSDWDGTDDSPATTALSELAPTTRFPDAVSLPPPQVPAPPSIRELAQDVDRLLSTGDDVLIGRESGKIFTLADRLVEAKREEEALRYLSIGLQHDAWALDYQLLDARLRKDNGDDDAPATAAALVLKYAEQDRQINGARQLLGQAPLPKVPPISPISTTGLTIVLVPIGPVDVCVAEELRQRLEQELAVTVLMLDAQVMVPPVIRSPAKAYLATLRRGLQREMGRSARLAAFLERQGITPQNLETDAAVAKAGRYLAYSSGGAKALAEYDAQLGRLEGAEPQREIRDAVIDLSVAITPFRRTNVRYLGLVNFDVFADQSNFMFYLAEHGGDCAVVSYRRFTADFNRSPPNRERLVDRAFKSSLASIGFMLGIKRCSDPTCPRAYPHSLEELDATSLKLCDACARGFRQSREGGFPHP